MKALNAPIVYDMTLQSFIYQEEVNFACGFYEKEIHNDRLSSFVVQQTTISLYLLHLK